MTATIVPFPTAAYRQVDTSLADLQAQTRRETARLMAEQKAALEEAERIRAGYVERQARIEVLLKQIHRNSERA